MTIGDSFFYFFGNRLRYFISESFKYKLESLIKNTEKRGWLISLVIYIYVAFTSFPNNVLTGALAITGFKFRKVIIPLLLGDMTLPLIVVFLTI